MTKKPSKQSSAESVQQLKALTDALQRERADAVNLRRQHEEQLSGLRTVVKADVVRDLLPVIDNFERALKHAPAEENPESRIQNPESKRFHEWVEGVKKIVRQFESTLENMGVERIATVGQPFDPTLHEAVSMEEGEGSHEVVSEELQAGYKIGDNVIRHAMVKVRLQ